MRLDSVMLYVKDFPAMRKFYQKMLRTPPVNTEWTDTWALFDLGGVRFALHAIPEEYAAQIEISSPPKARENDPVKLIFAVDNLQGEKSRLEALGGTLIQRPWQGPATECDFMDPEGNVFRISSVAP